MAEGGDQDDSQRTEDPTPKKLEEAKKRGQVPMSKEANTWVMLLIGTIVLAAIGPDMMMRLTVLLRTFLDQSWQLHGVPGISKVMQSLFVDVMAIITLPFLILFVAAAMGPFAQIGPIYAPESIKPKLDKISPIAGAKRLFSKRSLFEFVKGLIKVGVVGAVSYMVLLPFFGELEHFIDLPTQGLMAEMLMMFIKLMTSILTVLTILTALDVLFQRYTHMQEMRMSRQEIKDEYRQTEGDPIVRSRLRQMRMERARKRMIQDVPDSTVVITNPTHYAVALKYEPETMDAPVCIAKGLDRVALRIREVAEENGVIIFENPPLARTLHKAMEIDDVIPTEHYKAVAEVISYVFRMKKKL